MYLRWQYKGASWIAAEGKTPRSRRFTDKRPVAVGESQEAMKPLCRYRLTVVESQRTAAGKHPRARVVCYLGILDEAALHPYVADRAGQGHALTNRNTFVTTAQRALKATKEAGDMSEAQYLALRAALDAAFPKMTPPPGRSYVVIPAAVRAKAEVRWEADAHAFESRQADEMVGAMMGLSASAARAFMKLAQERAAKDATAQAQE